MLSSSPNASSLLNGIKGIKAGMMPLILFVSEMVMIGKTKIRCMDSIYPGFLFDPRAC